MKVFLHNSLTKKKEFFVPAQKNIVKIYVCGVTVYDLCHLGHARGAINFDVLKKLFQTLGYQVIFVKNYTDIDDKIIAESNKLNIPIPKATENVTEMIASFCEYLTYCTGAFNMPARSTRSPNRIPRRLVFFGCFPKHKI